MTKRQAAFIKIYFGARTIREGLYNGAAAARAAGYSVRTARQMAYKLRQLPAFKKARAEWHRKMDEERDRRIAAMAAPLLPGRWFK